MLNRFIYGIGGLIAFVILLTVISPSPEIKNTENNQSPIVQVKDAATTTAEVATSTPIMDESKKSSATSEKIVESVKVFPAPDKSTEPQYTYYSVTSVVDGDTIKISMNGKEETLRLIGIDTPETVDPRKPVQCFGKEASNKAKELLSGKKVRIEMDATQDDRDKYGRLLAYTYREDGLFYNQYIIEQGYAHEYTYNTPYKYQAEFKAVQKSAQENQRGLWSPSTCNGDTTSSAVSPTPSQTAAPSPASEQYYTSSYHTSKNYYPASCPGWKSLSPTYLKVFDSLEALLAAYPSRTLSSQCQ